MNLQRLYEILYETTCQLRNGEVVTQKGNVTSFNFMPHENEVMDEDIEKIDMCLLTIGVSKSKAMSRKAELIDLLDTYPNPKELAEGPSYIAVGGMIGDQGAAFQLFALGQVLGLWQVITPMTLGIKDAAAKELAGSGLVMCSGYRKEVNK